VTIARFVTPLRFEDHNADPEARRARRLRLVLVDPLVYDSALLDRTIVVPAGFVTDLASIPRLLWNVLPPIGAYDDAAVVHDYLFQRPPAHVTVWLANGILNEAMRVDGVDAWQRRAIFSGVQVGGWVQWNRYRQAEAAAAKAA
jgi:hypothetical protein